MEDRNTLEQVSRVALEVILTKEPSALTEAEKLVLLARRDYLTADEIDKFIPTEIPVEKAPAKAKKSKK